MALTVLLFSFSHFRKACLSLKNWKLCLFIFLYHLHVLIFPMVNTCAGIDPLCTEQVNKIYVYFFNPLSLVSECVLCCTDGSGVFAAACVSGAQDSCSRSNFWQFQFWFRLRPRERKQLMNFNEVLRKEHQLTWRWKAGKLFKGNLSGGQVLFVQHFSY